MIHNLLKKNGSHPMLMMLLTIVYALLILIIEAFQINQKFVRRDNSLGKSKLIQHTEVGKMTDVRRRDDRRLAFE